jgi:hypothetical protein
MRNQEFSMSWSDVMKASAAVALHARASSDEGIVLGMQAASWDPYEVWLSRIKKPRDRAGIALAAGFSKATFDLPE